MPTRTAKLGRERTIATLVKRVYDIPEGTPPEVLRRAEARMLAANPRLATAEGFASGASIVVPSVPGLRRTGADADALASGDDLNSEIAARLEALQSRIDDAFRLSAVQRAEVMAQIGDRAFVAEMRKALPQSTKFMSAAKDRLAREEAEESETAKRLQAGVVEALEGLKALDALIRRQS